MVGVVAPGQPQQAQQAVGVAKRRRCCLCPCQVDKKMTRNRKEQEEKRTGEIQGKRKEGKSIYENVDLGKDNTYANAAFDGKEDEVCQNVQGEKCGRDEDGLVYVGIDFSSTTPSRAVHKTEESVEYVSIDWNKKAQPLPDGDEQKEGKSQK
ncbi:uncharacterized protein LOC121391213 [Gigantopelta aegis]|uniref:uncharacterized protein LOC121391213 n=1 Tax=Gigantopelta aegis TaxID=1735272 RepID=UPI001B88E1C8|nr:uncharacterized protein LOC121391213 [Gigantopelta aegis]